MKPIIKHILLIASRDWLFLGLFLILILCGFLASFFGSTALSEQHEMQLVFLAGTSRLVLILGMILFICFHIRRSFENKEIDFIISRPVSRLSFLLAYFISFIILCFILTLPLNLFIYFIFKPNLAGFLLWSSSMFLELIIISIFAILSSLILKSAVASVMASLVFYFISRIMGFAISSIILPAKLTNLDFNKFLETLLKALSAILPRLDQFAQSKWLIYGQIEPHMIGFIIAQSLIYIILLFFTALFDFKKKQF